MTCAYPDFGYQDPLHFELQENADPNSPNQELLTVWKYLYYYVAGKDRYQRFNNIIEKLRYEKNNEILQNIKKAMRKLMFKNSGPFYKISDDNMFLADQLEQEKKKERKLNGDSSENTKPKTKHQKRYTHIWNMFEEL